MATQRYISTSFWTDKWIRELDPSERYLYMYLLTNSQTNISGIYSITLDRIAFDTGYDERTLKPMLERFAKRGKAFFVFDEYIILPSWPKHQKWESKASIKAGIDAALKEIPQNVQNYAVKVGYQYPIGTNPPGTPQEPTYSDSDSDSDSEFSPVAPKAPIDDFDPVADFEPNPAPPKIPAVAGRGETPPLFIALRNAFQSKNPTWPKPDAEVQALHWIVAASEAKAKDLGSTPDECALVLVTKFWELKQTGRDFWRRQPFQPTRMKSLWGDLMAEIEKAGSLTVDDGSWIDAYREGA